MASTTATTRRSVSLEARLTEWAREYGGGKYDMHTGFGDSPLASLMKWNGRPPTGLGFVSDNLAADEVQDAIDALSKQARGWLPACVIRCEYLTPGQPMESKLQRLRSIGENVARTTYYKQLRHARAFVAERLGLRDEDDLPEETCL